MENLLITKKSQDYELLDSGDGEKLERFGEVVLSRPDPQALWSKRKTADVWGSVHARFSHEDGKGKWVAIKDFPKVWNVTLSDVTCTLKLSPFKHLGIFPEQSTHWRTMQETIQKHFVAGRKLSVLNLFGYTGGASVACARAGAEVCHVDASESAVKWSKTNREASRLSEDSIRFIVDDARKFVEREIRRGKKYDIVIMDPPIYGRGSKNELWKIEDDLVPFLSKIKKVISDKPVAILLNGYASGYSHVAYKQLLEGVTEGLDGQVFSGELAIEESESKRLLPCGIYTKWESE